MRNPKRVFYDGNVEEVIELPEDVSRRLKTVMRLNAGDPVEILTRHSLAFGFIGVVGKKCVSVKIETSRPAVKPAYSFTAYQCAAKREYMDVIAEKYAEMGVTRFVPVISSRSLPEIKENSLKRFEAIAAEAALQSENEFVMEVGKPIRIEKIKAGEGSNILFHERFGVPDMPAVDKNSASMIIGPEGGFTENEKLALISAGFTAVTPIKSILKAETAAVLFAGLIRMELG